MARTVEERRAAHREAQARYRITARGRAQHRQDSKKRHETHRDDELARNRAWRAAHPERHVEARQRNLEHVRKVDVATQQRRRARLAEAPGELSTAEWLEILEEFDNACAYCQARGVALEQEHMTPIVRGGRHDRSNVVPACRTCNARKHTRTLFEFLEVS